MYNYILSPLVVMPRTRASPLFCVPVVESSFVYCSKDFIVTINTWDAWWNGRVDKFLSCRRVLAENAENPGDSHDGRRVGRTGAGVCRPGGGLTAPGMHPQPVHFGVLCRSYVQSGPEAATYDTPGASTLLCRTSRCRMPRSWQLVVELSAKEKS